ncbi:MAG: hypothetical protein ACRYFS_09560, partial [Janthinobacterium lividum]
MSSELSPGAGPARQPAVYGMEWGAFGLCSARQTFASNAGQHYASHFDPCTARHADLPPETCPDVSCPDVSCPDVSCPDVGVIFDVCLPKDQAKHQQIGGDFADVVPLCEDWVALFLGDACGQGAAATLAVPQAAYSLRR